MLQQEEQQRKSWEMKAVASEKQLEQLQVRQALAEPRWLVARGQLAEAKQERGALPDVFPLILSGLLHLRVVLVILSEKHTQEGGRREGELTRRAKPRGVLGLGPYVVFFLNYYYYFFPMEIESGSCSEERHPVTPLLPGHPSEGKVLMSPPASPPL